MTIETSHRVPLERSDCRLSEPSPRSSASLPSDPQFVLTAVTPSDFPCQYALLVSLSSERVSGRFLTRHSTLYWYIRFVVPFPDPPTAMFLHLNKQPLSRIFIVALLLLSGCGEDLRPVGRTTPDGNGSASLPQESFVINVGDSPGVGKPFTRGPDVTAAGGSCIALPEGAQTPDRRGRVVHSAEVPGKGTYYAWVRARWNDSCGNSVSLKVGDSAPSLVGEDHLYGTWHWVPGGRFELDEGHLEVTIIEREDGVAVDQVLFTPRERYRPVGPVGNASDPAAVRRFADDFSRSPGHGMAGWELASGEWDIAFSFDPNRIPHQYSLRGRPGESHQTEARAFIDGPPWRGSRLAFSVLPDPDSRFGVLLDGRGDGRELKLTMEVSQDTSSLNATGTGVKAKTDLDRNLRPNQWHRISIERWAWVLRVSIDGKEMLFSTDVEPSAGAVGLFVSRGTAFFDDLEVSEIRWKADDGHRFRAPWEPRDNARWFRPAAQPAGFALLGRRGALSPRTDSPVQELIIWDHPTAPVCEVSGAGVTRAASHARVFRRTSELAQVKLLPPANAEARIEQIAFHTTRPRRMHYEIGPYHFSDKKVTDPSDYLDFTDEEYEKMRESPEAEKLRRRPRQRRLLGKRGNKCVWQIREGKWTVRDGMLVATGPGALLRHWQNVLSPMEISMRVRLSSSESIAGVSLYQEPGDGVHIQLRRQSPSAARRDRKSVSATLPDDDAWHDIRIRARPDGVAVSVDGKPVAEAKHSRGPGGGISLEAPSGVVHFDDIAISVPRHTEQGAFYGFKRRETDWWRSGGQWLDHGGLACILASSWISLAAPSNEGMLWNKKDLGPNLQVAFNIEENSEWYGWNRKPTHRHHPFDNIRVALSPRNDIDSGYCVELNADDRSSTILYRKGEEVKRVAQDDDFPMRYRGGHSPYRPRKNRISVLKRDEKVTVLVNGQRVLSYTDESPVQVSTVGIGGYQTRVNFSHVEVRRLGPSHAE